MLQAPDCCCEHRKLLPAFSSQDEVLSWVGMGCFYPIQPLQVYLRGCCWGEHELTAGIALWVVHMVNKIIYNEISLGQAKLWLSSSFSEATLKQLQHQVHVNVHRKKKKIKGGKRLAEGNSSLRRKPCVPTLGPCWDGCSSSGGAADRKQCQEVRLSLWSGNGSGLPAGLWHAEHQASVGVTDIPCAYASH